jgi:ATP-binding cassette subfamily B protein
MNILQQLNTHRDKLTVYLRRYKKYALFIVLFVLGKEAALLAEPWIYRNVIGTFQDFAAAQLTQEQVVHHAIWLMALYVIAQSGVIITNLFMLRFANLFDSSIMRDAANDFVAKVLNLSFRFHSERKTGKLAKEFARGINGLEALADAFVFSLMPLTIRLLFVFLVYLSVDWILALVLFVMASAFCTFTIFASNAMQEHRNAANELDDNGARKAMDALMNAEAVKFFQQEHDEIRTFKTMRQNWRNTKLAEWNGWAWISTGQIAINVIAVTLMLTIMIYRLLHGSLSLPNFVLVISYLTLVVGLLWEFQHHIRRFQEAVTDIDAFFSYFDHENEIRDAAGAKPMVVKKADVQFDHVVFKYNDGKTVLNDISFTIPAGKSVAFVGPSGVGKSTIMKLLYRFYDPQSGAIIVDGQNIRDVQQQSLREQLSIVPQETALFNETIAYNIAYGRKGVSREEIEQVAKLAHIDAFIDRLPDGFDTLVGERGIKLSGGEKQRISIARAFLRNSPILVLDEATSSLDSAAESEIQVALRELMKDRTTLIIAHRLSTIMHADLIIVLNNGRVEQQGTHDELLQHGGLYQKLWQLQAGGYIE